MQLMAETAAASRSGSASGSASSFASDTALTSSSSPAIGIPQKTPTAHVHEAGHGARTVHPDLDVPAHVPYAILWVEDILTQLGHASLCSLDPHKSLDTYCMTTLSHALSPTSSRAISLSHVPTGATLQNTSRRPGSSVSRKSGIGISPSTSRSRRSSTTAPSLGSPTRSLIGRRIGGSTETPRSRSSCRSRFGTV